VTFPTVHAIKHLAKRGRRAAIEQSLLRRSPLPEPSLWPILQCATLGYSAVRCLKRRVNLALSRIGYWPSASVRSTCAEFVVSASIGTSPMASWQGNAYHPLDRFANRRDDSRGLRLIPEVEELTAMSAREVFTLIDDQASETNENHSEVVCRHNRLVWVNTDK